MTEKVDEAFKAIANLTVLELVELNRRLGDEGVSIGVREPRNPKPSIDSATLKLEVPEADDAT